MIAFRLLISISVSLQESRHKNNLFLKFLNLELLKLAFHGVAIFKVTLSSNPTMTDMIMYTTCGDITNF